MSTESLESTEAAAAARPGWSLVGKRKEKDPSVTDRGKRLLAMMDPVPPASPETSLPPVPAAGVPDGLALPPALPPSLIPAGAAAPVPEVAPVLPPASVGLEVAAPEAPAAAPTPEVAAPVIPDAGPPPVPAEVLAAMEASSPVSATSSIPLANTTAIPTAATAAIPITGEAFSASAPPSAPPAFEAAPVVPPIAIDAPSGLVVPAVPVADASPVALEPGSLPVDDSDGAEIVGEMDEVEPVSLINEAIAPISAPAEDLPIAGSLETALPSAPETPVISEVPELPEVETVPAVPTLPSFMAPQAMPDPLAGLPPAPGMPTGAPVVPGMPVAGAPAAPAPAEAAAPAAPVEAPGVPTPIDLPALDLPPVISEAPRPAEADAVELPEAAPLAGISQNTAEEASLEGAAVEVPSSLPETIALPEVPVEAPKTPVEAPVFSELPVAEATALDEGEKIPPAPVAEIPPPVAAPEPETPVQSPFAVTAPSAESVVPPVSEPAPAQKIPPVAQTTAVPLPVQSPFSIAGGAEVPKAETAPVVLPESMDSSVAAPTENLSAVEMPTGLGALPATVAAGVIASPFAPAAPRPAPPEALVEKEEEPAPAVNSPFQVAPPVVEEASEAVEIAPPVSSEPVAKVESSPFQLASAESPVIPAPVVTEGPTVLAPLGEEDVPLSPLDEAQSKIEALAEKVSSDDYVPKPILSEAGSEESSPEMLVRTPGAFLEEIEEEPTTPAAVSETALETETELIEEASTAEAPIAEIPALEKPEPIESISQVEEEVLSEEVASIEPFAPAVASEITETVEIPASDTEPEVETEELTLESSLDTDEVEAIEEVEAAPVSEQVVQEEETEEEISAQSEASEDGDVIRLLSPEEVAAKEEERIGAAAASAAAAAIGVPEVLIGTAFDGSSDDEVVNLISGETLSRTLRLPIADAVAGNFEVRLGFPDCSSYIFATVEIGGGHGRLRTGMVVNGCRAESVHGEAVLGSNLHELNLAFFLDGGRLQMRAAVVRPSRMGDQLVLRGLGSFIHPELHGNLSLMPIPDIREEQADA